MKKALYYLTKLICIILMIILSLTFISCGEEDSNVPPPPEDTTSPSDDTQNPPEEPDIPIVENSSSNYIIIIPDKDTIGESSAAATLRNKIAAATGVIIPIVKDSNIAAGDYEILIGATNRPESNTSLLYYDYSCIKEKKSLIISAGSADALATAVTEFEKLCIRDDSVIIPDGGISYTHSYQRLDGSIGGIKLSEIAYVYTPYTNLTKYVTQTADIIAALSGMRPSVAVGKEKPSGKIIELGTDGMNDPRTAGISVYEALYYSDGESILVATLCDLIAKNDAACQSFISDILSNEAYSEALNIKQSIGTEYGTENMTVNKTAFADPSFERQEWLSLNGEWYFSRTQGIYDGKINVPYSWESPLSENEMKGKGTAYYMRPVRWNPDGERVFLVFGAVDYSCEILVNGTRVGRHIGGYSKFEFDVTDVWHRNGENIIEVIATDTEDSSQVSGKQGYGQIRGIWQNVWLEARPENYISSFFVTTLMDGSVTYEVEVVGENGGIVGFSGRTETATVQNGKATLTFKIENPTLWEQDNPHLYYGNLTLTYGDASDSVSTYFGVREIGTAKFGDVYYITLNGKPVYLNGVLDQGFNADGYFTTPTDEYCEDEITRLKALGYNMIRYHAKAPEPLQLYYADKMGMLVMEDIIWVRYRPDEAGQAQFEKEMEDQIIRDRNHPSLFYWVVFNESWGLYTKEETANNIPASSYDWVVKCYNRVKELDPTRLVEDNSAVKKDHTVTDVNTWHMYVNGYSNTKKRIEEFVNNSCPGTSYNYTEGYTMGDVPVMNSECGNVWGVTGGTGESDISWQYKYMINEFRRHSLLNGFVFTEYRDVPNEFNGIYKLNGDLKDTGYSLYGISIKDLHSADYVGADTSPMSTVKAGSSRSIPIFFSSFTDERHGKELTLVFELIIFDPVNGDTRSILETRKITINDYGTTNLQNITLKIPNHDGVAELLWTLYDGDERITGNYILFNVQAERSDALSLEPKDMSSEGFTTVINAIQDSKVSGIGTGSFSINILTQDIPNLESSDVIRLLFEASTREPMAHDFPDGELPPMDELDYVLNGYKVDPGTNTNSFRQTDSTLYSGKLSIYLDGIKVGEATLADCPADSRGALSHLFQPTQSRLNEAGSYGYLIDIEISAELIKGKTEFTLTFTADEDSGLSLYGRNSGRYGIGILLIAEEEDSAVENVSIS